MGIKNKYNRKLALKIATAIQNSADSLETICDQNPSFPKPQSIRRWLTKNTHPEFTALYRRAKANQAHYLVDRMLDIANNAEPHERNGSVEKENLQIKTYQWIAARLKPKKYSEKVEIKDSSKPESIASEDKLEFIANAFTKALERKNADIKTGS